jgi:NAD+ synthase (glutamine-hydrolysing)
MKIAICQINTTIGDFANNAKRMIDGITWAKRSGADLAVFPEMTTCGYPPRDLLEKPLFIRRNLECVDEVSKAAEGIGAVIGFAAPNENQIGRGLYNVAALLHDGRVQFIQEKSLLPDYDVFDEARHFEPASEHRVCTYAGRTFALTLCEDIWCEYAFDGRLRYSCDPIKELAALGPEFIINISASPFVVGKARIRRDLTSQTARRFGKPVIYCNLVGGNDELIFDGQSMVVDAEGNMVWEGARFEEDRTIIDIDDLKPMAKVQETNDLTSIRLALVLGIKDYMRKCGFKRVVIGLSGGIDSAVVSALACEAIGPENVTALMMPSPYTSEASMDDAKAVAKALKLDARVISITDIYEAYRKTLGLENSPSNLTVAEENLQARARGNILMATSNREGALVLSTGNKSEMAVGYCTLYGDMAGGLAVVSDVPKTVVYELARYYRKEGKIPQTVIDKPPSAELKPDQHDQETLPPYEVLDEILKLYIEDHLGSNIIMEMGFDPDLVKKIIIMIEQNEYKRRQAPPGIKVTSKAFGSGRRFPIARKLYW